MIFLLCISNILSQCGLKICHAKILKYKSNKYHNFCHGNFIICDRDSYCTCTERYNTVPVVCLLSMAILYSVRWPYRMYHIITVRVLGTVQVPSGRSDSSFSWKHSTHAPFSVHFIRPLTPYQTVSTFSNTSINDQAICMDPKATKVTCCCRSYQPRFSNARIRGGDNWCFVPLPSRELTGVQSWFCDFHLSVESINGI